MFSLKIALFATLLSHLSQMVEGSAFLQAQVHGIHEVTTDEVETTFAEHFSQSGNSEKIRSAENDMRAMYQALPKNTYGSLQPATVRYAVHRYFVQKYGWYVKGLDPSATAWNASSSTTIMKERTPLYVQALFEQRLHGQGLGLHELAVFAVALADLVHKEAWNDLHKVFTSMKLPTVGSLPRTWTDKAVKAYTMHYIIETDMSLSTPTALDLLEQELPEIYPAWADTSMWSTDFRLTDDFALRSQRNPFVKQQDSFENTVRYVQEMGHNFGSFQKLECNVLKRQLVDMEFEGTGRVLLSKFYSGSLDGDWTFTESSEYLRNLGVLDETDPKRPSVMIPNYMSSSTNCLTGSGFYSVCCSDECEGLLGHLERSLAAPNASPEKITEVISHLPSDTVDAPRNISVGLVSRLKEIADHHGGRVPLHGRLFSQWMHHAYPRECPFPHVKGTIVPINPNDWMATKGYDVEASLEEMHRHHDRLQHDESSESLDLPWNIVEELVSENQDEIVPTSWPRMMMRIIMLCIALASFTMPLLRAYASVATSEGKADGLLV